MTIFYSLMVLGAFRIISVRTSQETHSVSIATTNRLMLFREIIAVYCENHTEHINTLCGQNVGFSILKLLVHIVTAVL
jgi:hypothetical protein